MYYQYRYKTTEEPIRAVNVPFKGENLNIYFCIENREKFDLVSTEEGLVKKNGEFFGNTGYIHFYALPLTKPDFIAFEPYYEYLLALNLFTKDISALGSDNEPFSLENIDSLTFNETIGKIFGGDRQDTISNNTVALRIDLDDEDNILAAIATEDETKFTIERSKILSSWFRYGSYIFMVNLDIGFTPNKYFVCSNKLCNFAEGSTMDIPMDITTNKEVEYMLRNETLQGYARLGNLFQRLDLVRVDNDQVISRGSINVNCKVKRTTFYDQPVTLKYGFEGQTLTSIPVVHSLPRFEIPEGQGHLIVEVNYPMVLNVLPELISVSSVTELVEANPSWAITKTADNTTFRSVNGCVVREPIEFGWRFNE